MNQKDTVSQNGKGIRNKIGIISIMIPAGLILLVTVLTAVSYGSILFKPMACLAPWWTQARGDALIDNSEVCIIGISELLEHPGFCQYLDDDELVFHCVELVNRKRGVDSID